MYNAKIKEEFLGTIVNDNSYRAFINVFNSTEEIENRFDKDICQMSVDELLAVLDLKSGTRHTTTMQFMSLLRIYVDWCINNGKVVGENNLEKISASDVDRTRVIRTKYIKSEEEFEEMCKVVYREGAFYNETVDKQKELMVRLCFMGMDNDEIVNLKMEHIDHDKCEIVSPLYSGITYTANKKIVELCDYCYKQTEFAYKGGRVEKFCDNDFVIRARLSSLHNKEENTEADPMNPINVLRKVTEFFDTYYDETEIYKKVTASKLRESGNLIKAHNSGNPYNYIKTVYKNEVLCRNPDLNKRRLDASIKRMEELYDTWKEAFYG